MNGEVGDRRVPSLERNDFQGVAGGNPTFGSNSTEFNTCLCTFMSIRGYS